MLCSLITIIVLCSGAIGSAARARRIAGCDLVLAFVSNLIYGHVNEKPGLSHDFESEALPFVAVILAVGLFAWRGLWVTSALYGLFLVLAALGLFEWRRKARA